MWRRLSRYERRACEYGFDDEPPVSTAGCSRLIPIAAVIGLRDERYLIKRFYSRVLSAHSGAGARTGTGDAVLIRGEEIS